MKTLTITCILGALAAGFAGSAMAQTNPTCPLSQPNNPIKHIVYLQYDNVHYKRDRTSVPSDLEQMPTMTNFLVNNGTLQTNDHTQIISHTADGIITSITGVYPDRHGQGVSNTYDFYKPNGKTGFVSSFVYWTDLVQTTDTSATADHTFALLDENGNNAPAPWAAYTKAGCDFGAVSLADMEFENTTSDIVNVFGAGSPEAVEGSTTSTKNQALADFEGIAIHCALGSPLCAGSAHAATDALPNEPGGYAGFQALFGHKYAVPAINGGSGVLTDLLGGPIQFTASNGSTFNGFPGFDGMFPKVTLSYVAQMLEAGVPVVYGYISDAHDQHLSTGNFAYGPGEAGYVSQLQNYDAGWAAFFARLAKDGIDQTNTLFVFTTEEGDHFVGGSQSPSTCDGVTVACTYAAKGEVDLSIDRVLATLTGSQEGANFDVHFDMSPNTWVFGNPPPEDPTTRQLERDFLSLKVPDPAINNRTVPVVAAIADSVEQTLLHMTNSADPLRVPTFTPFAYQDFFVSDSQSTKVCNPLSQCVSEAAQFAWNHGGVMAEISKTWIGIVGPGVLNNGVDNNTWTDHVDYRPTILALAGIKDSYVHDGVAMVQDINPSVLPVAVSSNLSAYEALGAAYKQLTAPFGAVGTSSLILSTQAVSGTDPTAYSNYEASMATYLSNRNALTTQIKSLLDNALFNGGAFDPDTANSLASQANAMVAQMQAMAGGN